MFLIDKLSTSTWTSICLSVLALAAAPAMAQTLPPPEGVVSLASSASVEVVKDVLAVTFSTQREGQDAGAVQNQLKQALEAALTEAQKVADPGQVDVQAGNFAIYPRYSTKGTVNGWTGTAGMTVEGRDMQVIAQLTARITTMAIARVGYSLSRETRETVEGEATAQAIARYRAKAADCAKNFGYTGYNVREVNVSAGDAPSPDAPMLMRAKAMSVIAEEALPVEPGRGTVTVTVSGTVQMMR